MLEKIFTMYVIVISVALGQVALLRLLNWSGQKTNDDSSHRAEYFTEKH